jgi:hypothetical protein
MMDQQSIDKEIQPCGVRLHSAMRRRRRTADATTATPVGPGNRFSHVVLLATIVFSAASPREALALLLPPSSPITIPALQPSSKASPLAQGWGGTAHPPPRSTVNTPHRRGGRNVVVPGPSYNRCSSTTMLASPHGGRSGGDGGDGDNDQRDGRSSDTSSPDPRPRRRPAALMVPSLAMAVGLPLVSVTLFPWMLQVARSLPANSTDQLLVVTALFVANRAYLYGMGATIVVLAALRGARDPVLLGRRITALTEELLFRPDLSSSSSTSATSSSSSAPTDGGGGDEHGTSEFVPPVSPSSSRLIESLRTSGVEDSFDGVSSETLAVLLPLMVSFLLALSVFLLPFFATTDGELGTSPSPLSLWLLSDTGFGAVMEGLLKESLPVISAIWNAAVLTIFTRAEVRRLANEVVLPPSTRDGAASVSGGSLVNVLEWTVAIVIAGVACFGLPSLASGSPAVTSPVWQAQNFVNMALAISVGRVIQLDRFPPIVGALALLTLYDATSVLLIPAAGAATGLLPSTSIVPGAGGGDSLLVAAATSASASSSGVGGSAMGSVAVQKLLSGTFQPGLLVTRVGDTNSLGGALGLGDAVFPSILATFARRFDLHRRDERIQLSEQDGSGSNNTTGGLSLFPLSIVGYLLGCTACEFVPALSSTGLPALVFIIPSMLGAVLIGASVSGDLEALWNYNATSFAED